MFMKYSGPMEWWFCSDECALIWQKSRLQEPYRSWYKIDVMKRPPFPTLTQNEALQGGDGCPSRVRDVHNVEVPLRQVARLPHEDLLSDSGTGERTGAA